MALVSRSWVDWVESVAELNLFARRIPLGMAATLGLSAVALKYDPSYPNYPTGLTAGEVAAGLPAAAAAQTLLKAGGAAALLVVLFLAVTSATAAELCATSTVMTYDIYLPYIRPTASEKELLRVDHVGIVIWCIVMAVAGCVFHAVGLSMGWLYECPLKFLHPSQAHADALSGSYGRLDRRRRRSYRHGDYVAQGEPLGMHDRRRQRYLCSRESSLPPSFLRERSSRPFCVADFCSHTLS